MPSRTKLDAPKPLGDEAVRQKRLEQLNKAHIVSLTGYFKRLRRTTGKGMDIPYFDPFDGGIRAKCLFIFETPGRKAVKSGFISRNNPDETAKNFFHFNEDISLDRKLTASWNIVPWYVGASNQIKPTTSGEISAGLPHLSKVIRLFHRT
jgi:hypothetical protein